MPSDVPAGFDPTLVLVLNLVGTFVFGLSGGLAAVRARLDLLGVVVLSAVVGLAGGVVRDLFIGVPPATFRDSRYLAAVVLAGLVCFFVRARLEQVRRGVMVLDAVGLGLFAVTGATKALAYGLGPVQAVLLGAITAIGGGMVRDWLLGEIPAVLREGLYAVPALLGAAAPVLGSLTGAAAPAFTVGGIVLCVAVRLTGLRYDVNVPTEPRLPPLPRWRRTRRSAPPPHDEGPADD